MAAKFLLVPVLLLCVAPQVAFAEPLQQAAAESLKVLPGGVLAQAMVSNASSSTPQKKDGTNANSQYSELRFGGIEGDGTIVFFSKAILGTMNTSPSSRGQLALAMPGTNSSDTEKTGGTTSNQLAGPTYAMARGTTSVVQLPKDANNHVIVPPDSVALRLAKGTETLAFGDKTIEIIYAGPESLTYRLTAGSKADHE